MQIKFFGRTNLLDIAVMHNSDAVGNDQCLLLIMCDEDGGDAQPQLQRTNLIAKLHADLGIKRRKAARRAVAPSD
jgi:hypothetical protein